ncbi:fumarylacetoacetate hydrolase family protein [Speluncibacter jeojiensis]|uniref:Fumarylacetoacetate hydrolase family protein n=1 Tax=Speluncibacter jeojiensis TaxID=2710754 RepID=A0A9X4RG64_9ACTN|nr:fumarylacetoacetate hydrolase family protein [Corynebacteriales bacterium D3-21]
MSIDAVSDALGWRPGKIIAVHLNYPARAAERGKAPRHASYFLKPVTSLAGSGTVGRPAGTELLGFEGEVALVIGSTARRVRPEDGWRHIGWVTAANDLGLYDLRYADAGSNTRSKGGDGYTPLGPRLIDASKVTPDGLRLRTWLDGRLVQDDTTADLLFPFAHLVADLSRVMTLEVGDVILTGTPAGASVAVPGQVVEVEVSSVTDPDVASGRLRTEVVATEPLAQWGSPAKVDAKTTADAYGGAATGSRLDPALRGRLEKVAVATLSAQLRSRGFESVSIDGVAPLAPGRRMVGTARTLRFIPYRKDLFAANGTGYNAQKRAIDTLGEGEVLVMEARGDATAGTLGDILALRALARGAAGIVTDGAVRDAAAVVGVGLPVYGGGRHPSVLGRRHVPWETDVTVACGGATVQVGDVIVGDDDGVIAIPAHLVEEVLAAAEEQERQEAFIAEQVRAGHSVDGLYPLAGDWKQRYLDLNGDR